MITIFRKGIACGMATLMFIGTVGIQSVAAQTRTLTCESVGGGYNYCRADTDNNVTMSRKLSFSNCFQGTDWGYDRRGIWVDHGCRAEFRYGRSGGSGSAIAGGAILGGLILAGVLASKKKKSEEDHDGWKEGSSHVASYYVGTFRGWNPRRNEMADITIKPDGAVSIWNEDSRYYEYGRFRDRSLSLPWGEFEISKDGDGFMAYGPDGSDYSFVRIR
ncbi:MAG: DUF3011 domain-containing protein [Pyrinomonadaceae bacterium]